MLSSYFNIPRDISLYLSFILSICLTLHAGTIYSFSIFSYPLSQLLNNKNIAIIGSIADAGFFSSIFIGYLYYYTNNFINITLIVSILLLSLGWLLQYLYLDYYFICFCFFLIGLGSSGIVMIVITFNSQNFPSKNRGLIIGILLAVVGICGIIWTSIYHFIYDSQLKQLFHTLGASTIIFGFIGYLFIQQNIRHLRSSSLTDAISYPKPDTSKFLNEDNYLQIEITNMELFDKKFFWLLFVTLMVNCGIVLSWKNHIGSLGLDRGTIIALVMCFVITNASSRFISGLVSDSFISRISRPMWMVITSFFSTLSLLVFVIFPNVGTSYFVSVCTALVYGTTLTINSQLVTICFGVNNYGINIGYLNLSIVIGSFTITSITTILHDLAFYHKACDIVNPLFCFRYPILFSFFLSICPIVTSILIWVDYPPRWLIPNSERRRRSSLPPSHPEYLPIRTKSDEDNEDIEATTLNNINIDSQLKVDDEELSVRERILSPNNNSMKYKNAGSL